MTKKDIIEFWIKSAKDNLKTAKAMLISKRWNFAMFMCQQTIEAFLKAIYIHKKGERPPYIHKLPKLADLAGLEMPEDIDIKILKIDAHYIKARYFADRFNRQIYNKKKATSLVDDTEEVFKWLQRTSGLKG